MIVWNDGSGLVDSASVADVGPSHLQTGSRAVVRASVGRCARSTVGQVRAKATVDPLEWPEGVKYLVPSIAGPMMALHIDDSLFEIALQVQGDQTRGAMIASIPWFTGLLLGAQVFLLSRVLKFRGAYLFSFGLLFALYVVHSFRSDFIRAGTFDLYMDSRSGWMMPLIAMSTIGAILGSLLRQPRPPAAEFGGQIPKSIWLWPALLFAAAGHSYESAVINPTTTLSSWAPSRHVAQAVVAVSLCFVVLLSIRSWRMQNET